MLKHIKNFGLGFGGFMCLSVGMEVIGLMSSKKGLTGGSFIEPVSYLWFMLVASIVMGLIFASVGFYRSRAIKVKAQ